MAISDNLQKLRKLNDLSQEQMAEMLNMSKNGYGKLERGESKITVEHLQNIANVFNIDIADLLKEERDFSLLIGDNHGNYANKYYDNAQEVEKLQLIINHQKQLLEQKDKEIELLRRLLDA
ncbi:helix-turn-helix domain-containing protein [Moraxella canis]|uniref:HTH cro/C1-type domain-containing protein n=1 Tax=Moraxella canis TaxID=90239 RepID=A0A1S9ZG29_9GAMM|nr:helix-turn-helix transcriptional regulator [Moraxella canis]OOR82396.1 hypothetical protein B0180_09395 [Moraxella canis]